MFKSHIVYLSELQPSNIASQNKIILSQYPQSLQLARGQHGACSRFEPVNGAQFEGLGFHSEDL